MTLIFKTYYKIKIIIRLEVLFILELLLLIRKMGVYEQIYKNGSLEAKPRKHLQNVI